MPRLLERLASPHRPGALLQAVDPRLGGGLDGSRELAVVAAVVPTGTGAAHVRLRTGRRWRERHPYVPGQHVVLGVDVDGVRHRRCFSITSAPGDELLEVTVQSHPGGTVSRHLVEAAVPGETVELGGVGGDFVLPVLPGPQLMVTGGSGLTPVMAMLRHLARRTLQGHPAHLDVVVVHHVTSTDALLFDDELPALAAAMPWLRLELVVTRDDSGGRVAGVHLCRERMDELCADWRSRDAWVCGPRGMVEAAQALWEVEGPAGTLHVESFGSPVVGVRPSPAGGRRSEAAFASSGTTAIAPDDQPLLEVAEAAGLTPAFGCRAGVCHTCSTRLDSGVVRDLRDGRCHDAGASVRLCVSAAVTDVTLDL